MFIVSILIAILMFGLLIALHEFGHFAAAKLCGVKVNEFAIGMGPQLFHRQKGETEYSLRLLPIGGFCAMEGEEEGESPDPRAFPNRTWWQKLIILLAGVAMNFLTGFFIILCFTAAEAEFSLPVVNGYTEYGAAQAQGLEVGDRILAVDGHAVYLTGDIEMLLFRSDGTVTLTVDRQGEHLTLEDYRFVVTADEVGNIDRLLLGIVPQITPRTVGRVFQQSCLQSLDYVRLVWMGLGDLVAGRVGLRDMSGVVEITKLMAEMGEAGAEAVQQDGGIALLGALYNILQFTAFIAINLAVMNLLPIPALDGGQILFMVINGLYTAVTKRRMNPKYLGWVSAASLACLMALMLAVMASDILKQFGI